MFATLLGGLPRPLDAAGATIKDDDAAVVAVLEAQIQAGLEPLTDGRLRTRGWGGPIAALDDVAEGPDGLRLTGPPRWNRALSVDSWRFAADHAGAIVKQALPGPYTLGRRLAAADPGAAMVAFAQVLRSEVLALADAGCSLVEIEERDAHLIGTDPVERRRFAEAHQILLDGITGIHVSLVIIGGNADSAGIETILAAPYASLAVDLIDGPDNWRLVTSTPGDRGIVCGALSTKHPADDGAELLLWAAAYAAASGGRGRARVGLATAGGLGGLSWAHALEKLRRLGHAAHLAAMPLDEAAPHLDPRAIDLRSAATGRYSPEAPRKPRRPLP